MFSKPELPGKLAKQFSGVYSLVLNKYWIDELYNAAVVRPLNVFARIVLVVDGGSRLD